MWTKFHPSLQKSFYNTLDAPSGASDAELKMTCHKHAVCDIDMQMEALEAEIELEKAQEVPYNEDKIGVLYERRIKLINAKRYHTNASNAYWYAMQS